MAEALAVVGVVASIVQLVDFGSKVLHRLNDFKSSRGEIPKTFKHIKEELPILLETLTQINVLAEKGNIREETKNALLQVINGCQTQITLLDNLISSSQPQEGDSLGKKTGKAILSLRQNTKITTITAILHTHIQSLTNYHVTASSILQTVTSHGTACVASTQVSPPSTKTVPDLKTVDSQSAGQESSVDASMANITRSFQEGMPSDASTYFTRLASWDDQLSTSLTAATDLSFLSSEAAIPHSSPENGVKVIIRVEVDSTGCHQEVIDVMEDEAFQAVYEGILRVRNIILERWSLEPIYYHGAFVNSSISASGTQDHTFPFNSTFLKAVLEQFNDRYYTSIAIQARFSKETPTQSGSTVHRELLAKLEAAKVLGADGQFVPLSRIKEIITADWVRKLFVEYYNYYNVPSQLWVTSDQVSQHAPRLLATIILACVESLVPIFIAFWENGFSDSSMPLDCSQLPPFCRRVDYDAICATHPQTLVAEISPCTNDLSIQTFSYQYRLPFIKRSLIGTGGFSQVFEVTLHTQDFTQDFGQSSVAVKRLSRCSEHDFRREFETLRALSSLKHPHLINLLSSFKYCGRYHLVFPLASGSLRSLLIQYNPSCDRSLIRWMWRQLSGVADGLHCFHTLPVKRTIVNAPLPGQNSSTLEGVKETGSFCSHYDLKPDNILVFRDSSQIAEGIFRIADFGLSSFHGRSSRPTPPGTLSYSPPECDIRSQEPLLGSPYDIWSFGGILSEVVAWILGGPREIEVFRMERKGYVFLGLNSVMLAAPFYYYERGKFSISPAVDHRLEAMIKRAVEIFGPSGSKSADQVADLIKACLTIDPYQRPTARVVADRLNEVSRSLEVIEEFDAQDSESLG